MMDRGLFLKKGAMLVSGTVLTGSAPSFLELTTQNTAAQPFQLNYGFHQGQFENHAGPDFLEQIKFGYDQGFRAIEDNGFGRRTPGEQEAIGKLLRDKGMQMGVFVLEKGGNGANTLAANKPEHVEIFLKGCHDAVVWAKRSGGKYVTVVPGNFQRNLPLDLQTSHVIEALKRGAEILEPHGLVMVLEPLSDSPDLFLRTSSQSYMICKAVASPSCKILFDAYHLQKNEGDLINNLDRFWEEIAYIQVGDNPGRKEPGTGEINYLNLFKHLYQKGYRGVVGMEHGKSKPGKEGEILLIEAYRKADSFTV